MSESSEHVLLIGGSHGVSYALVRRLIERDCKVTCLSRTMGQLQSLQSSQGAIEHREFDVLCDEIDQSVVPSQLTGFVYCPGSITLGPLRSIDPDQMRKEFELNVVGATRCFQQVVPALKKSGCGSAIFFTSIAAIQGIAMHSCVAAVKGGLLSLAKTWAAELAPKVRVNSIAPALTDTPLAEEFLSSDKKRSAMAQKYPMGRYGQPNDIAAMADFLLSGQSHWITGQSFSVDGGMSSIVPL